MSGTAPTRQGVGRAKPSRNARKPRASSKRGGSSSAISRTPSRYRILTWEEFSATPRTAAELASYRPLLEALQRMGLVDGSLNVVG